MTFDTGASHNGFSFSGWGWDAPSQVLYPTNAGVGDIAQITKNSLTWDLVSFQTRKFGNGNGTWEAKSDKGDVYTFVPNQGSGFITHTLNWVGISWLQIKLININNGGNQSFDFDNVIYFENNTPPCIISLDGISKLNATCCQDNGIIIVTPASCTCVGQLEYSADNGATWQTSNFINNLAPGNYTVKIRDSGNIGCQDAYIGNPVVVTAVPDVTLPNAVCQNQTVQLNSSGQASITGSQLNNGSTDNCDFAGMTYTANPGTLNCSHVGTTTVTLTVTDNCGNTKTCTSTVTVQNLIPPTAVCRNATVQLNSNGTYTLNPSVVDNGSTFNCGAPTLSVSPNSFNCNTLGSQVVTLTATGNNGLTSTCTATVTVQDLTPPAAQCNNVTVQLDANGNASVTTTQINNNSADACGIANMSVTPNSFTCSNVGTNTVTLSVTDVNNNTGTCTATVTVKGLSLGDLVYKDLNRNGVFDGTDEGINGVLCKLYIDDGDGVLDSGDGASIATFTTTTLSGQAGYYTFQFLCPNNYIVEIAASNFNMGGPLYDAGLSAALVSSPIGGATDPDDDLNDDDNGDPVAGYGVASNAITLSFAGEPTSDGDSDNNTNLSLDFGFKTPTNVSISDVILSEGTGGTTTAFNFTVTRTNNLEAFSLTVNTANGTASNTDNDFTAISGGTVSFTAGGSLTETVSVLVNQDNKVEANETFNVVISNAPPGVNITDGTGMGTINNDDNSVVTLSGSATQNEGTSFVFTATLSNPVQGGFSVAYSTHNGTATTTDNDYTDNDGALSFTGNAGEPQTITVASTTDSKVELDETFTVALGAITGAPAGVTTSGSPQTGTIQNNDAAVVSIAANVSQPESTTPQIFSVTLSNPVDVVVTLQFSTSDGSATTTDNDYTGIAGQTVTFPTGSTTAQTVNVTIVNDNKVENAETYDVAIGTLNASGRNVSLGTSAGTGTINNDDAATVTLSGGGSANEGNTGTTPRVFTATLNNPVQGGFTVPYTTDDGTATTANSDYVDNDGTLTFAG
ncbi:MAG: hypothetical protein JNJ57_07290, partial [Saprospiraceae bacterium]|nr:hypothetical protein [Saprospiraceae bacterium]